jgi:uncharacterized protein YkwD
MMNEEIMIKKIKVYAVLLLILLVHSTVTVAKNNWDISLLHTASDAEYLTEIEKEVILEINKLRSNPVQYAEKYIAPLARHFDRKILHYPGDHPLLTNEGVSALHECVRVLKKQQALPIIYPSPGLTMAARDHVKDQSKTGKTGHTGGDRSTMRNRVERYGEWQSSIAENIAYGAKTAQQIVIYLLIDDGVPDRGHRKNLLNPQFKTIGVATGSHPQYGIMSVMNFAGGFITK